MTGRSGAAPTRGPVRGTGARVDGPLRPVNGRPSPCRRPGAGPARAPLPERPPVRPRPGPAPLRRPAGGGAGRRAGGSACPGPVGRAQVAGGQGRVRLTARGRRLVLVLCAAAALILTSAPPGPDADALRGDLRLSGGSSVVVEPGDTLWSLAVPLAGDGDVREVVHELRELNDLESAQLQPGQVLRLP